VRRLAKGVAVRQRESAVTYAGPEGPHLGFGGALVGESVSDLAPPSRPSPRSGCAVLCLPTATAQPASSS